VISAPDRTVLLKLARDAIVARATGEHAPPVPDAEILSHRASVFVTLHHGEQLRGCIGHLGFDEPFSDVIPHCAAAASSEDPRFPAVTAEEIPRLSIEVSVLTPLEPINGPDDIEVGRHGLVVESGRHRGLLLPQVAIEWNWNAATFLGQTCHKAGLPIDAWKHGARIWRFQAEVFSEPPAFAAGSDFSHPSDRP
jgi:AmmeMemoRadiSam system protein A